MTGLQRSGPSFREAEHTICPDHYRIIICMPTHGQPEPLVTILPSILSTELAALSVSTADWRVETRTLEGLRTPHEGFLLFLMLRYVYVGNVNRNVKVASFFPIYYCIFTIYSRYLKSVISKRDGCEYLKQVQSIDGSL
jgi:hypothetical protein